MDKIKELIKLGLENDEMSITKYSRALKIKNKYVEEYLQIIKYISDNPIQVKIDHKDTYTFVKMTKKNK